MEFDLLWIAFGLSALGYFFVDGIRNFEWRNVDGKTRTESYLGLAVLQSITDHDGKQKKRLSLS